MKYKKGGQWGLYILSIWPCEDAFIVISPLLFHYYAFITEISFTKGMKGKWNCRTSRTSLFFLQNKFSIVVLKKNYFEQFFYTLNFLCWTLKLSWGTSIGSKVTVGSILKNLNYDDSFPVKEPTSVSKPLPKEGRRQLPPIPSPDTQLAMASEIKQRQNNMPKSGSNGHGQLFTEYKLMAE